MNYITVKEASLKYFSGKISVKSWYRLVEQHKIQSYRVGSKILLLDSDIEKYIASFKTEIKAKQVFNFFPK